MLSAAGDRDATAEEAERRPESHTPLLYYELQTALKSLLKHINLPLHQVHSQVDDGLKENNELGSRSTTVYSWSLFGMYGSWPGK